MAHPFRFGIQLSQPLPGSTWAETARKVEDLGYSSLHLPDHFGEQYGPLVAMTAAVTATTSLKVGALVLDNDYRHPVVLAKEIATLDVVSNGRVEFGLGAGWMRSDYEESGIPYDDPVVRVDRFEEAVAIFKGLFGPDPFSFAGRHYTVTGLRGTPTTRTPGGPPLLIGGGGPRMLRLAGAHADIVGVNPTIASGAVDAAAARDAVPERVDRKVAWVREGAGDRFDDLELNVLVFVAQITDDATAIADALAPSFGVSTEEFLQTPSVMAGTRAELAERLEQRRERWGLSYVVFNGGDPETMAPLVADLDGR